LSDPTSASVLAFTTTVQAAIVLLRRYRSPGLRRAALLLPALAFVVLPWVYPTVGWVAGMLAAQVAWFAACELLTTRAGTALPAASGVPGPAKSPTRPLRSKAFVPVQILAVHDESDEIRTFRLARPETFAFAPGQFLTVRVQVDGRPYARCYSISSAPSATSYLEISVRRQGLVSGALHANAAPGSVLFIKPPAGRFVYPAGDTRPIVLVAGGVGITPCMSMLRHASATEPDRRVTLLFSVRSEHDVPFEHEIAEIARRHPQVRVAITVTRAAGPTTHRVGRLDESMIRETLTSPADSLCYLCGPTPMVDAARAALIAVGVPAAQIHDEVFQAAVAIGAKSASGHSAVRARLAFDRSHLVVDVPQGATLLEAAESAGVRIPSLCRSGVCGTCKTRLISGDVQFSSDAVDADERAQGYILPCVAWPAGDCNLEA
jgi:glycine betaine monooxygenase B